MTSDPTDALDDRGIDDERGSEVDDYTGEIPRVDVADADVDVDDDFAGHASGFGDGDVADVADVPADAGSVSDVAVDVDALIAERDDYEDRWIRTQAEYQNYRKRMSAQLKVDADREAGRLAEALLPVLDAAESAYVRHPDEIGPLLNLMLGELGKHGLETLDLESQPFDPEVAEAVAHEAGDGGEVVVAEVLRSGYRWRGQTLRAAMVRTRD